MGRREAGSVIWLHSSSITTGNLSAFRQGKGQAAHVTPTTFTLNEQGENGKAKSKDHFIVNLCAAHNYSTPNFIFGNGTLSYTCGIKPNIHFIFQNQEPGRCERGFPVSICWALWIRHSKSLLSHPISLAVPVAE